MSTTKNYVLLELGEGAIEAGVDQQARLDEFTERLGTGEFHIPTSDSIPYGCIDGRDTRDGLTPRPDSAGGTESLFVADDLTAKRFAGAGGTTREAYAQTLKFVHDAGYPVGGHTDSHAQGAGSGCGANDKLPLVYDFMARQGSELRKISSTLGVVASDEAYEAIVMNAMMRAEFSNGRELLDELQKYGDVDMLDGDHREVAAVINTKFGTTLDRIALKREFGDMYEAFNVDAWIFRPSAEMITPDYSATDATVLALAFYNLATAHVLCGKGMRVVIL